MLVRIVSRLFPQMGIKTIDPNDISSVPEEVGANFGDIQNVVVHAQ